MPKIMRHFILKHREAKALRFLEKLHISEKTDHTDDLKKLIDILRIKLIDIKDERELSACILKSVEGFVYSKHIEPILRYHTFPDLAKTQWALHERTYEAMCKFPSDGQRCRIIMVGNLFKLPSKTQPLDIQKTIVVLLRNIQSYMREGDTITPEQKEEFLCYCLSAALHKATSMWRLES